MAALKRRQFINKWQVRAALCTGILILFLTFCALMYAIHLDYQKSKYHLEDKK